MLFRSAPARSRRRAWSHRLSALLVGSLAGLLLCEVLARALAFALQAQSRAAAAALQQPDSAPRLATRLVDIVHRSTEPRLVYELIPAQRFVWQGVECRTNALGYRGAEWPTPARQDDAVRIVGLGDSVMFGWGVAEPDCYLNVLQRELAKDPAGRPLQILNTGVPGYNTAMEVAALECRLLPWRPEIVLIDWVGNDADLPNLVAGPDPLLDSRHSYFLDLLRQTLGRPSKRFGSELQAALWAGTRFESDPDRVPTAYRDMVGERGVERALQRLQDLAATHSFRTLAVCHHSAPPWVRALYARLCIPLVENEGAVNMHLRAAGRAAADYPHSDLVLSAADPHPSAVGHRLFAATIAAWLRRSGWLSPTVRGAHRASGTTVAQDATSLR